MLRTRIAAAGAAFLLFAGLTIAGAGAQSAPNPPAGKPLQLLKIIEQPSKARTKPHAKLAAKSSRKQAVKVAATRQARTHIATAGRKLRPPVVQAVDTPAPGDVSPPPIPAAPADVAAALPVPQPVAAPTVPAPTPDELVVAGQSVKVASPDDVNEIDLAANDKAGQTTDAMPTGVVSTLATREPGEREPKPDNMKVAIEQPPASPVGSTSWILQVMAALGGAVTAGSVAWFLMGSAPQRTYG
jgi:hypothetical protein